MTLRENKETFTQSRELRQKRGNVMYIISKLQPQTRSQIPREWSTSFSEVPSGNRQYDWQRFIERPSYFATPWPAFCSVGKTFVGQYGVEREMQCYQLSAIQPSNSVTGLWTTSGKIVKAACTPYEYIDRSNRARYEVGGSN